MTHPRGRVLAVLLAALVLLAGANLAAYAAAGRPLLLGRYNAGAATTKVEVTGRGPALALISRPNAPSLAVSSTKRVPRLNADRVDGLDGAALQSKAYRYRLPATDPAVQSATGFPGLPAGVYLATYSVISGITTGTPTCYLRGYTASATSQAVSFGSRSGSYAANNASAVIDARTGVQLICTAGGELFTRYTSAGDLDSTASFVRLDTVVKHDSGSAVRPASRGRVGLTR